MKLNHKVILLASCIFCSCSYLKNVRLLTEGEIRRENYVEVIPFDIRKDLIVIKARLNADSTEREFIFDTGAFNSKVESGLADRLNLEVVAEKTNSTAQGISQKIEVVRIDSLQLGNTKVYTVGAGKLTYATTSASHCIADSGIIGANIIKLANWKIDYENQLLYFSDTPFEMEEDEPSLSFLRPTLSATPKIDVVIEGKAIENVLFDVGYNGGLVLPLSLAGHFKNGESTIILDESTSGIYGSNADSLLVKNLRVALGGKETHMPVEFSALNKALLGNEFLKHFLVIINNDDNEIYLQKRREINIAPPRKFLVSVQNDWLWAVSRTTPNIPLKLGDTLLFVNGRKPHELFSSHCDYVMNTQKFFYKDTLIVRRMDGSSLMIIHP